MPPKEKEEFKQISSEIFQNIKSIIWEIDHKVLSDKKICYFCGNKHYDTMIIGYEFAEVKKIICFNCYWTKCEFEISGKIKIR